MGRAQEKEQDKENDSGAVTPTSGRKRRRRSDDDALLGYLRESDAAAGARHDAVLQEMGKFQTSFATMFGQLLNKM